MRDRRMKRCFFFKFFCGVVLALNYFLLPSFSHTWLRTKGSLDIAVPPGPIIKKSNNESGTISMQKGPELKSPAHDTDLFPP
ncbi:Hypothetical protein Minf_2244 [Methylacidiphilum infernorum V4]|uniref:Uncharacterized protein n=1 Tax=Methylacidiphilum infernorum (isolate V4) TaxID=481448 RepID=B3DZW3_METI4|nr:Hypothetical protein Minf_2244 [Methylacidiphilum infernorum V4]